MAITAQDIQTYARDIPELNILLENQRQSSPELVTLAMKMAVSDFNALTPSSSYSETNFPNDSILLYGTLHHLANSEAERQLRNNVNFNAQGLQAGIDDKMGQYNQLASYYKQLFENRASQLKRQLNIEAAWGGSDSPYSVINDYEYRK